MLDKFAAELKEARENKGITLQQIAIKTRIDLKFLEAIEKANFEIMPEVYMRAFIKEYARAVDMDEDSAIKKYEMARSGKTFEEKNVEMSQETAPVQTVPTYKPEGENLINDNNKKAVFFTVLAGIIVVVAVAVYMVFFGKSSEEIITEKPYEEVLNENRQRFEETDTTQPTQQQPAITSDSLALSVRTKDKSWIGVRLDGVKTAEVTLESGQEKVFKAKEGFRLVIGNAASIEFFLNGQKLEFTGKQGRMSDVIINSNGITISKPETPKNDKQQ